ncbi:MAG: hypothetical protein HYZ42_08730 [Bacteroidetes bacterium]|nr:hypothetical protein [Bacteroidota bacterium]
MKTDNFDDAIKGKLESIEPKVTDADIDKVHQHVLSNLKPHFFRTNLKYILASAATVSIVSLVSWNIYISHEKEKLSSRVEELNHKIEEIAKTNEDKVASKSSVDLTVEEKQPEIENQAPDIQVIPQVIKKDEPHISYKAPSNRIKPSNVHINPIDNRAIPEFKSDQVANNNDATETKDNVQINEVPTVDTANDNREKVEEKFANLTNESPDSVKDQSTARKPKAHSSNMFVYQIGVGLDNSKFSNGFHAQTNFIFNNRYMLSIGVQSTNLRGEHYRNTKEFHDRNDRDFHKIYAKELTDTNNISQIDIHSHVVQIPLAFSYKIPLKSKFSILVSGGTNLDLTVKQEVEYRHRFMGGPPGGGPEEFKGFIAKVNPSLFNNALVSLAVEKQVKSFAFQLGTFNYFQVKPVPYRNERSNLGFRFRVLYTLGS